jgi:putative endonuclease
MKCAYVYVLASGRNGTLYIGVATDLLRRLSQHLDEDNSGFTGRYGVRNLFMSRPSTALPPQSNAKRV